jgi:hypothetical protein
MGKFIKKKYISLIIEAQQSNFVVRIRTRIRILNRILIAFY